MSQHEVRQLAMRALYFLLWQSSLLENLFKSPVLPMSQCWWLKEGLLYVSSNLYGMFFSDIQLVLSAYFPGWDSWSRFHQHQPKQTVCVRTTDFPPHTRHPATQGPAEACCHWLLIAKHCQGNACWTSQVIWVHTAELPFYIFTLKQNPFFCFILLIATFYTYHCSSFLNFFLFK